MSKKIAVIAAIIIIATTIVMPSFIVRVQGSLSKVALIVGGDESDLGFSLMAILGAEAIAAKYPSLTVSISKNVAYTDQRNVAVAYGDEGYDVVFCVGGQFMSMLYGWGEEAMPALYPDTIWVQVPGAGYSDRANLVALGPSFQVVGHYLAGLLAAKMTKTGAVGWIVGTWYEPGYLCMEANAFIAGVHSVNSSVVVYTREVGGTNPWGDPATGKIIAQTLINTYGVDIIAHVADFSGRGVMEACAAAGSPYPMVIGCVADQWELCPNNMVTSILMDTARFMDMIVQCILGGAFLGYKSINMDLSALASFHNLDPHVPQDVKDLLAATANLIKTDLNFDGKVDIKDIFVMAKAFGSYPGHARWDTMADVTGDNKVDIRDIYNAARSFGKTFTPVPLNPNKPPEQSP
jgi:basic membrane lipoprotein Med (substrate-binding protein (PBP1-ABC) superfamily)